MEPKPLGIESEHDSVDETTEAGLNLNEILGQVVMTVFPRAAIAMLIENAASDFPLTSEWEAFRDGVLEVAEESRPETES